MQVSESACQGSLDQTNIAAAAVVVAVGGGYYFGDG